MRKKVFFVKDYLKKVLLRKRSHLPVSGRFREDNLSLYRSSRTAREVECPNLPLNLLVEVTSKCNLKCKMCNIHHDKRSGLIIPDVLLDATFELAKTASVVNPFGLGEPLLHPKIAWIVGRYKSLGAYVGFTTNGMLLGEEISRGLIINKLDYLAISIDAADPVLFEKIRRGADLQRISDNIQTLNSLKKYLNSKNPALSLSVVAQAGNFAQLIDIIKLAEELEIFAVDFSPITVHKHISEIQNEALGPSVADWRKTLEVCNGEAAAKGVSIDTRRLQYVLSGSSPKDVYRETTPCPEPFRFMVIRANGDIFPCCNWDVNKPIAVIDASKKISVTDLEKAWRSPKWQALREKVVSGAYPEECRICMTNFTRPFED